ncbi:hypothetical protein HZB05_01435 [Candidatus Wolfebacteria bacterium]|nr:hypothetical protein [Candidatus Wolfebacteria bacterium]
MNIINRKKLIIIIILFTFIASIFIVYWLFAKRLTRGLSLQSPPPSIITPTTTPTISFQTNTAIGMKAYTNTEFGFEFQYPKDWAVEENYFKSYYSKFNLRIIPTNERHSKIPIGINIVLPEFADNSFRGIEKAISEIIVDGITGTKYEYEFGGRQETAIILPLGEYRLILWTDDERYAEIFNQVLTAFKFLKNQ